MWAAPAENQSPQAMAGRREPSAVPEIRAPDPAQQHVEDLAFLSRTAMGFVELAPDCDIYEFIGERLCEIIGDAIAVVASQEDDGRFRVRFIRGLGPKLGAVARLIGIHPDRLLVQAHPASVRAMTRGRLTTLELFRLMRSPAA
jgi:hypothetical protein